MWKTLLLACSCFALFEVFGAQHRGQKTKVLRAILGQNCTNWDFEPCMFNGGAVCGIGKKVGRSLDSHCPVKEKLFKCKVSCDCQYKIHSRGNNSCDGEMNRRIVSLKLTRGDATKCAQTKVVYRNCKKRVFHPTAALPCRLKSLHCLRIIPT